MEGSSIIVKDLLLVGGGHTHVHTIKMLGMDPIEGVRVTLITRDLETPYSGMLPGYVAGYYTHEECHIDLVKLCAFGNVRLIHAEACDMNVFEKVVYCKDNRPPVRYDVVSIDIGISPIPMSQVWGNSSINEGGSSITPVKPIDGFAARWAVILDRIMAMAAQQHQQQQDFHLRIVGGGGGGVELAFALHHRLHTELSKRGARDAQRRLKVSILHRGNALMSSHKPAVQAIIARRLKEKNIAVHLGAEVAEASTEGSHKSLRTTTGASFAYDEVIWCTGGRAQPWLRDVEGLSTTEEGFIRVGPTLESESIQDVYAAGDVCHLVESPRPKAGVFAVRAGPPLTANLRGRLLGRPAEEQVRWVPQADFLGIVGVGDGEAVASKGPLGIEGAFVWKLKDRIDRLWMKMYQVLPDKEQLMRNMKKQKARELRSTRGAKTRKGRRDAGHDHDYDDNGNDYGEEEEEEEEEDDVPAVAKSMGTDTIAVLTKAKMRCGGCGSKIGATVLSRVLARVKSKIYMRPEVVAGAGDDAAIVLPPQPQPQLQGHNNGYSSQNDDGDHKSGQQVLVHTIDYFRSFIGDPFVFGKIAANHSLSDIHAMNGTPVTALALCVIPYGPEPQVEASLEQMLCGCLEVLREEKCTLAGGHTSEGSEPALGLAVNGVADLRCIMRKGPVVADHVIVLTKALGTGTLLAADMRGRARGSWVAGAIASMVQSNRQAAAILHQHGCKHCTDVTGFGFMGHLLEMIKYQGESDDGGSGGTRTAAHVNLSAIPTLPGATECVQQGILSTLHPANIRCSQAVANLDAAHIRESAVFPLLFDPQTAGGLLATVPRSHAPALIAALHGGGYSASAVVGEVVSRSDDSDFAPLVHLKA